MPGYLLDTNVLSEVLKKRPSQAVVGRLRAADSGELLTSSVCVMEMRFGAARHPNGRRLWLRIEEQVLPRVRILPLGAAESLRAGDILAALEARGEPVGLEDVLIGATALVHGLTVATRNTRHMGRIDGLAVESWWP